MRLSVSNIAWDLEEEESIADLLRTAGVTAVDLAPGKYFPDPPNVQTGDVARVREWWASRGLQVAGLQALLFGTSGLNLFQDDDGAMLARLGAICRIGGGLGARALTFGSPRQRDRGGLSDAEADRIAIDFFRRLGEHAIESGVIVCLEPNPTIYGCNFMVTTPETARIVAAVSHPGIALQLDVGALMANGEDPDTMIDAYGDLIGHVHASEPGLVTLGDKGAPHAAAGAALRRVRPDLTVTIEMAASVTEPHAQAVGRAVALAKSAYGAAA